MKNFEVWLEGYFATGCEGVPEKAKKIGEVEAETFREACDKVCARYADYDADRSIVWICRLFDNEADARESFG